LASCGDIRARSFCSWGGEIAQEREWDHDRELDWHLLDDPTHTGIQRLVRDLNRIYVGTRTARSQGGELCAVGTDQQMPIWAIVAVLIATAATARRALRRFDVFAVRSIMSS